MGYKKKSFGHFSDKSEAYLYTLTNSNGVSASFTDIGATWVSMLVPDKDGRTDDILLGYDNAERYFLNSPHFGAVIGRYANRIGGASYTLNGKTYKLKANSGSNNLHSGPDFYHIRRWYVQPGDDELGTELIFSLKSPDMDQGFPGNADITVSYTLTEDNSIIIRYTMVSDKDTIANFTNHAYFNLAGHSHGDILKQQVFIDADYYTPVDANMIPTGEIAPVDMTPMDFRKMKAIGDDIEKDFSELKLGKGYDHNWVINGQPGEIRLAAKAFDPDSKRIMEVYTDLPGVQLYTGNFLDGEVPGKSDAVYAKRSGYCFETQYFPDAVNKSMFQSPVIKAGSEYKTTTIYKFNVRGY